MSREEGAAQKVDAGSRKKGHQDNGRKERVLTARYPRPQIPHFNAYESISPVILNRIILVILNRIILVIKLD